jgi:3-oxoadipate enol-lactonase
MPIAQAADGARLHYSVHDYTDPWREAPTIVLQHGFARSGKFWFNVIPYLARFYRVICPDLRGLGESVPLQDPSRSLTVENCIEDIVTIADHAGLESFHLAGESIAGGLGLMFAGMHPKRLRSLCVIAPAVYANEWIRKAYAVGYPSWEEAIRDLGVEGWVRKSNTLARFPSDTDPRFLEWYAREVGKGSLESVAALTRFAGSVDARPYLDRIEAPVLVLNPTGGQIATKEMEAELLARIPKVRLTHLRTPYQMLNLLKPAECAHEILHFAALQDGFVPRD